jgi:hypothetical protein
VAIARNVLIQYESYSGLSGLATGNHPAKRLRPLGEKAAAADSADNGKSPLAAKSGSKREVVVLQTVRQLADMQAKQKQDPHHTESHMTSRHTVQGSLRRFATFTPRIAAQCQKSLVRG